MRKILLSTSAILSLASAGGEFVEVAIPQQAMKW